MTATVKKSVPFWCSRCGEPAPEVVTVSEDAVIRIVQNGLRLCGNCLKEVA